MKLNRRMNCPCCSYEFDAWTVNVRKPFSCPNCEQQLRVSPTYSKYCGIIGFGLSFIIVFGFGLRGLKLVLCSFAFWLPIVYFEALILNPFFPPKPTLVDNRKSIE